jgi:hypothetical protein
MRRLTPRIAATSRPRVGRFAALILSFAAASLGGCGLFGPRGVVSNVTHQEHPELINGQFDWGSEIACDVRNQAERGTIHITATLSTSEGQWSRSQDLVLEKGQTIHLTYFFQEPTINATNYQAVVHVEP